MNIVLSKVNNQRKGSDMWWTLSLSAISILIILTVYVIYGVKTGLFQYNRFMAQVSMESIHRIPTRAREEISRETGTFIRGVIFFNTGQSFHFTNRKAYRRAVKKFKLLSHCISRSSYISRGI